MSCIYFLAEIITIDDKETIGVFIVLLIRVFLVFLIVNLQDILAIEPTETVLIVSVSQVSVLIFEDVVFLFGAKNDLHEIVRYLYP